MTRELTPDEERIAAILRAQQAAFDAADAETQREMRAGARRVVEGLGRPDGPDYIIPSERMEDGQVFTALRDQGESPAQAAAKTGELRRLARVHDGARTAIAYFARIGRRILHIK